MSTVPSTSTSHPNFVSIFNAALETYKRKTKKDLASHPLLPSLQSCGSPEAVLTVLREQIPAFSRSQKGDGGVIWKTLHGKLCPKVHKSATLISFEPNMHV
jgi:hypothetical protein